MVNPSSDYLKGKYVSFSKSLENDTFIKRKLEENKQEALNFKEETESLRLQITKMGQELQEKERLLDLSEKKNEKLNACEKLLQGDMAKRLNEIESLKVDLSQRKSYEEERKKLHAKVEYLEKRVKSLEDNEILNTQNYNEINKEKEKIDAQLLESKHKTETIIAEKTKKYIELDAQYKSIIDENESLKKYIEDAKKMDEKKENFAKSIKQNYVKNGMNMFIPRLSKDAEKIASEMHFMYSFYQKRAAQRRKQGKF